MVNKLRSPREQQHRCGQSPSPNIVGNPRFRSSPSMEQKNAAGSEHGPPNNWCRSDQGARPKVAADLSRARCRHWMSEDAGRKERDWSGSGKNRSGAFAKSSKRPKQQLLRSARIWIVHPTRSLSHMTPRYHHQSLCSQCSVGSTVSE